MTSQERAKRSPVPRDPRTWAREVDGVRAFLDRLPAWEAVWGPAWVESMGVYYRSRLELLLSSPPPKPRKRKPHGRKRRQRSRG